MESGLIVLAIVAVLVSGFLGYLLYRINKYLILIISKENITSYDHSTERHGDLDPGGPIPATSKPGQSD
jgi:hypothetical protein